MGTVIVFGTFDNLHPGHESLFAQAKEHGERLVAIVGRDETVRQVKGKFPRENEDARLRAVAAHPLVDMALLGRTGDKLAIIAEINPDCVCLGYDQEAFTEKLQQRLRERGLKTQVKRMSAYKPGTYKSSLLAETKDT